MIDATKPVTRFPDVKAYHPTAVFIVVVFPALQQLPDPQGDRHEQHATQEAIPGKKPVFGKGDFQV